MNAKSVTKVTVDASEEQSKTGRRGKRRVSESLFKSCTKLDASIDLWPMIRVISSLASRDYDQATNLGTVGCGPSRMTTRLPSE